MAKARHMHIVSGVLLISFHLCTMTLINGSLSTLKRGQAHCPCRVEDTHEGTVVDCRNKSLDSIPSCIPASATHLSLSKNRISQIEDFAFAGMRNLTVLDLSINHISHIEDFAFAGMHRLKELSLLDNHISHIKDFTFAGMHRLDGLDIGGNNLTAIRRGMFVNLTNLSGLQLSDNCISHIEDFSFAGMHRLEFLFLSDNCISHFKDVTFNGMHSLKFLFLHKNKFTRITRGMIKYLSRVTLLSLSLSDNHHITFLSHPETEDMRSLDFSLLKAMHEVSLKNLNQFTKLNQDFVDFHRLEANTSKNSISHIDDFAFSGMHNLESLNLSSSNISHIEDFGFSEMQALSILDLSNNNLTAIKRRMFMKATSVKYLKLRFNHISHIEEFAFAGMQHLSVLDLRDNDRLQLNQILCALNKTKTFHLREHFSSLGECRCQLLDFQKQKISACPKVSQTDLPTVYWTIKTLCHDLPDTDTLMVSCEESGDNLKLKPEIKIANATFILVTAPNEDFIIYINLTSKTPEKVHLNALAIDYNPVDNRIYWISQNGSNIYSAFPNGTDKTIVGTEKVDSRPGDIAVDPYSRLVFYSEKSRGYIALITMSSLNHTILIDSDLVKPGPIVLDVWNGYMCWIDNGTKKIECANYDGTDRRVVVFKSGLHNPLGLALDVKNRQIYWSDVNFLYMCNLDRCQMKYIDSSAKYYFRGLTIFGGRLYVINSVTRHDTVESYVYQYELDGRKKKTVFENSSLLHDIHIFSETLFYLNGRNSCEGSQQECSHICIPSKHTTKCLCPDELSLSMDGKTCVPKRSKTYITEVLVGTVFVLLIAVAIFVLIMKRERLHSVQRNQEMEMKATRISVEDQRRTSNGSNEYSEIHEREMDVLEDLPTQPEGKEDNESADQYNVIDLSSISSSPVDSTSFHPKCGLDIDGYSIPVSEPHQSSQRNLDEQEKHPSETTSYLELEP